MNIASLLNTPQSRTPAPRRLQVVRVQALVLAQGAVESVKDGVKAFRHMRDVLTGGYAPGKP